MGELAVFCRIVFDDAQLGGFVWSRALPLTYTNVVYLMSHLGLAIALIGGGYSAMTMERRTMVLFKEDSTQVAYDRSDREYKAPFAARLKEFRMDTFAPTLTSRGWMRHPPMA